MIRRSFLFAGIAALLFLLWFSVRRPYTFTIKIADGHITILENTTVRLVEQPMVPYQYASATVSVTHDRDAVAFLPFTSTTVSMTTDTAEIVERIVTSWSQFLQEWKNQVSFFRTPYTSKNLDEDVGIRHTVRFPFPPGSTRQEFRLETMNPKELRIWLTDAAGTHTTEVWVRPKTHHDGYLKLDEQSYHFVAPANKRTPFYLTILLSFAARTVFAAAILWAVCFLFKRKKRRPNLHRSDSFPIPGYAVWCTGIVAAGCALWIAVQVLEAIPHTQDEVAYLFQAKIFSRGHLYEPSFPAPLHRFFDHEFIMNNGKWFSLYTPLHPLVLAVGALVSFPAIINPLLMIGSGALLFAISRRVLPPVFALIVVALFLFSPFSLLNHASFFSHPLALLLTLASIHTSLLIQGQPENRRSWLWWGGCLGLLLLTRPANAIATALCFAPYVFLHRRKNRRNIAAAGLVFLCFQGLQMGYNAIVTGNPWITPLQQYSPYNTIGFGLRGVETWGSAFTFTDALSNLAVNTQSLLHMAFLWPPFFTLAFVPFAWMGPFRRFSFWLTWYACVHIGIYFFYFHEGAFYGPRYWFEVSWIVSLLTVMGIVTLWHRYNTPIPWVLFFALALYGSVSTQAILGSFRGINAMERIRLPVFSHPAVVFVDGRHGWHAYGQYFSRMDDPRHDRVIYARDQAVHNVGSDEPPLSNALLRPLFPDRTFYRYENGAYIPLTDAP